MQGSGSYLLKWQSSFDAIGFSAEKTNKRQNNIIMSLGKVAVKMPRDLRVYPVYTPKYAKETPHAFEPSPHWYHFLGKAV